MHKTIFTWFGNLPMSTELQGFHYYQERMQSTKIAATIFSLSHEEHGNHTTLENPDYKRRFHNGLNRPKKISQGHKPPLHGLSLSKSPIKNHATLFGSGQVVKPDQIKLGSIKPNIIYPW